MHLRSQEKVGVSRAEQMVGENTGRCHGQKINPVGLCKCDW